jgi:NADH:ubiquinone oxidoreductase subunit E
MVVNVCVGSSCHLKGSYDVIQTLKRLIEENGLEGKVELKASFCLGDCSNGVSMKIDDRPIQNATPENIIQIFENEIKNKV